VNDLAKSDEFEEIDEPNGGTVELKAASVPGRHELEA
jgi:hypothetical protein